MLICKFCSKECKNENSQRNHERLCKENPVRQFTPFHDQHFQKINKENQYTKAKRLGIEFYGKQSKEARERIAKLSRERRHTTEAKEKMSKIAKERGWGGHTSKQRLYFKKNNGDVVYLQSSYEIKFANLLEEMNIEWSRPEPLIWTDTEGTDHRYYPDFKIGDKFFDTKNDYLAKKDANKIECVSKQNNVVVEIVTYENINVEYIQRALLV